MGVVFMGFCPGIECLPHMIEWILLAPCMLLAFWSIRVTSLVAIALLVAHFAEMFSEGGFQLSDLWAADGGIDKCFWLVVVLLAVAALVPRAGIRGAEMDNPDNLT